MRLFSLLFLTVILSFKLEAQGPNVKVLFIDSSICLQRLDNDLAQKITNLDKLKSSASDCLDKLREDTRPYHAQFVLEVLLSSLDEGIKITLHHYNVFNQSGQQDFSLWQKALSDIDLIQPELILMTTGGLLPELWENYTMTYLDQSWSIPTIISSGQIGPGISLETKIWPHDLIDKNHSSIELIGADSGQMLYKHKIKESFSGGLAGDLVRGSSRAAAIAAAKSINQKFKKPD